MRQRHIDFGCLPILKVMGVAVIASMTTACSSDVLRFSDAPFGNPFQGRADTASTGAVNAPIQRIKSATLGAPPSYQPLPGNVGTTGQLSSAASQVAASGNQPITGGIAGWTATGGTPVTIGAGDTVEALSSRYGVPVPALRAANGMSGGQPSAGQRFVIPAYKPGATAAAATKVASNGPTYSSASTTQASSAPRYESITPAPAKKAAPVAERKPRYESLTATPKAKVAKQSDDEDEPARPAKKTTAKKQLAKPVKQDDETRPVAKAKTQAVKPVASAAPAKKTVAKASVKQAVDDDDDDQPLPPKAPRGTKVATAVAPRASVEKEEVKTAPAAAKPETTASTEQEFRWPARGRVISGYGSKGPSGNNDGINIAVPEGTPVKAAESGTVAYAGEEIKGYGKMVLIRHPNGYVSAYAHNGDLNVKRGEVVKRGQLIAKSGQTGNVTSPQLHFELRKGSDPVDPSKFLD